MINIVNVSVSALIRSLFSRFIFILIYIGIITALKIAMILMR